MHANSTLKSALQDRLWQQDQARQSSYLAAEESAKEKARAFALSVHAVTARYVFAPAHDLFRFTAQGVCTQAAMTLTEDGSRLTVIAKIEDDGETCWFLTDVSNRRFDAAVYIAAVQARLENNRRAN